MQTKTRYPDLHRAVQSASIRVLGYQDVNDSAHARCMAAILRAYGESENAFLYAEPHLHNSDMIPDLVLSHPETGVMVFEVKAYDLEFILGIEAGNLKIKRNGHEYLVNPIKQAQRGMFAIKEHYEQSALDSTRPLFNAMVALPNISEQAWVDAGYEACIQRRLILFADDCVDTDRMKARIGRYVHQTLMLSGLSEPLTADSSDTLFRAFGESQVFNRTRRHMRVLDVDNLGAEIDHMEAAHKQLSAEQQELARVDTWGHPYLLRGVAGSGKSIVLAYHVAWSVLRHQRQNLQLPLFGDMKQDMPKIAVVGLQRTLVPLLRDTIEAAYQSIAGESLPPDVVTVSHLNGLVYDLAQQHDHFHYVPMTNSRDAGERSRKFLAQLDSMTPDELDELRFDALYIDEGQDVHPDTFALLYTLVRPDPTTTERTISIYYDDAQNIYGHPRPTWRTYGLNVEGGRAAFMKHCYRNSQEIVEFALNVLLGTAADEKTRVRTRRYADVYTLSEKKLVEETTEGWRVSFAKSSGVSPQVHVFPNRPEQVDWVAQAALTLIEDEQVRPEDILILAAKASTLPHVERIVQQLSNNAIRTRIVGGKNHSTQDEPLLMPDHLTLTTIHAAKGYDAPIAILMDVDELPPSVTGRAMFYVGATRAKRYLLMTGVKTPDSLLAEAQVMHRRLFSD